MGGNPARPAGVHTGMKTASLAASLCLSAMLTAPSLASRPAVLFATRGDERITALDAKTLEPLWNKSLGVGAHELAISPDGAVAAGSAYGGPGQHHHPPDHRLAIFNLRDPEKPRIIDLKEHIRPNDLAFFPDNRHLLVTSEAKSALLKVDTETGEIVQTIALGHTAGHMLAADFERNRAYVSHVTDGVVTAVDLESGEVLGVINTGPGAEGIAVSPDGKSVWCANNRSNSITIIDTEKLEPVRTFDRAGFPFRVRFTPDGTHVIASLPESASLAIFDATSGDLLREASLATVGPNPMPTSIATSPDSTTAYVVCNKPPQIVAVEIASGNITAHHMPMGTIPDGLTAGTIID